MNKPMYEALEAYMYDCMKDSAHDREHIFRVLYTALYIEAKTREKVDYDVLVAACLLHDTGRSEQFADPKVCHAQAGGIKAKNFLLKNNWDEKRAEHVNQCISTHRYRGNNIPGSIEAKILFDADKLDASGCLGIARTLLYQGQAGEPIYTTGTDGICDGENPEAPESFYREYNFKLKRLYSQFYTPAAKRLARKNKKAAEKFFNSLRDEISGILKHKNLINQFISG